MSDPPYLPAGPATCPSGRSVGLPTAPRRASPGPFPERGRRGRGKGRASRVALKSSEVGRSLLTVPCRIGRLALSWREGRGRTPEKTMAERGFRGREAKLAISLQDFRHGGYRALEWREARGVGRIDGSQNYVPGDFSRPPHPAYRQRPDPHSTRRTERTRTQSSPRPSGRRHR